MKCPNGCWKEHPELQFVEKNGDVVALVCCERHNDDNIAVWRDDGMAVYVLSPALAEMMAGLAESTPPAKRTVVDEALVLWNAGPSNQPRN